MTTPLSDGWTADEGEAARRLDDAIDALLAGRTDPPETAFDSLERTAALIGSRLPPLHPRFGFEERLAQRLQVEATDAVGTVVEFPAPPRATDLAAAIERAWRPGRWSLVGAVASALSVALTLAGAVFVVLWRRARGSDASEGVV